MFGFSHAVYYVREGEINMFALNMKQELIPPYVDHVDFTWQSSPVSVPYTAEVTFSGTPAIRKPGLNISTVGLVPSSWEVVRMELECSGRESGQVDVALQVGV